MQSSRQLLRELISSVDTTVAHVPHPLLFIGKGIRFRKLEVILTTSIEKLGRAGETVKVAPGHFRNHLMPKLLAVPKIVKYEYLIKEQQKLYQRKGIMPVDVVPKTRENKMKEYEAAALRLERACLRLRRLIKGDNELQSPVTKDELVYEVARQLCVSIQLENLYLPAPLTSLGQFEVPLHLPKAIPLPEGVVQWYLKVKIRRK